MLLKKNRLTKENIEEIFKKSSFVNSSHLTLKYLVNKGQNNKNSPKISFIVPKTVSKKAVVRNMLRRRGYKIVQDKINDLPFSFKGVFIFSKKSVDVFGQKEPKNNKNINLKNEIQTIFNKIY